MNKFKRNETKEIYQLAQNGITEAENRVVEACYDLVKKKAIESYNIIEKNIIDYFDIDDLNYSIPTSLLNLDDVIQDYLLRTISYVPKYFNIDSIKYFSSYVSHMLSSYMNKYISFKTKEIIYKYSNYMNVDINFQYYSMIFMEDNNDFKNKIIENICKDVKLSKYIPFINLVFKIKDLDELSKFTGLDIKDIKLKIYNFSGLYLKYINNNKIDSKLNYIVNGKIFDDLKSGKLFEMLYFSKETIVTLHDIYFILSKKFGISYSLIKKDFCDFLSINIVNNLSIFKNVSNVEDYYNYILRTVKVKYLLNQEKKLKHVVSKKWNKYVFNDKVINEDEVYEQIKKGNIYFISPYKEYIDIYIQTIYNEISQHKYIDIYRLKLDISAMIDNYVKNSLIMALFNLSAFNNDFIVHLNRRKKLYVDKKIFNDKKELLVKQKKVSHN